MMAFFGGGQTSERSDSDGQREAKTYLPSITCKRALLPGSRSLWLLFVLSAGQCAEGRGGGKLDTVGGRAQNEKGGGTFF